MGLLVLIYPQGSRKRIFVSSKARVSPPTHISSNQGDPLIVRPRSGIQITWTEGGKPNWYLTDLTTYKNGDQNNNEMMCTYIAQDETAVRHKPRYFLVVGADRTQHSANGSHTTDKTGSHLCTCDSQQYYYHHVGLSKFYRIYLDYNFFIRWVKEDSNCLFSKKCFSDKLT